MTVPTAAPYADDQRSNAVPLLIHDDRSTTKYEWDRLAGACNASFRCGYHAARAWQLDHHVWCRMRRYAFHLGDATESRIGQVAIGTGSRVRAFADGLQLLPHHADHWASCMRTLLETLGPGVYHYGSRWNLEPARDEACAQISGVHVVDVRAITMYAVHFARWSTWDAYIRDVSENARRNARKAAKLGPRLSIEIGYGARMLRYAHDLLRLRRDLYARKGVAFSMRINLFRLLLRAVAMRDQAFIAIARRDNNVIAAFGGITFGRDTYFMDSAAVPDDDGAYWFLMLRMLEDAYRRAPQGRFVTGAYYANTPVSKGLDFFRYQCRAEGHATSEFTFRYG